MTGLLVLLHGHGDDPAALGAMAQQLDPQGRLRRMIPSGQHRTPTGPAWLTDAPRHLTASEVHEVLDRLGREIKANQPAGIRPAVGPTTVEQPVRDLATGDSLHPHDHPAPAHDGPTPLLVLAGYSQGAAVALAYALAARAGGDDWARPTHLLGFGAFLLDPTLVDYDPDAAHDTRWWLAHGRDDPVVPIQQGRSAARWLRRHDLDVTFSESDGGHELNRSQVEDARQWLARQL